MRLSIVVALIGCGASRPAAPSMPVPAAGSGTPAPQDDHEAHQTVSPPLIPAVCRGDHFDARDLVAKTDCVSNRGPNVDLRPVIESERTGGPSAKGLPAVITLSVEPNTFSLAGGTTTEAALVMTNTSSDEVVLSLFTGCANLATVESEIDGAYGERIDSDPESTECALGAGVCGTSIVTVALEPGGTIRAPFTVDARRRTFRPCIEKRVGKVAAGSYTLRVRGMANLADLTVPIRIR